VVTAPVFTAFMSSVNTRYASRRERLSNRGVRPPGAELLFSIDLLGAGDNY
jgi:hypothetical protein